MYPILTKEMTDAIHANSDTVRVLDPNTQQIYILVEDETYQRAMEALRQQTDLEAIQAGIADWRFAVLHKTKSGPLTSPLNPTL